ncbi:hypothetical protein [Nostoc parmelioides]|uniref:Uncharacterized protein n=1 Tax=Nostoc parmelioides FACHB-3921 TaxID=2692909 RepID=A0ABR8BRP2_9NOSO|nr:hypothetical protein [Nostoc parmelioides]MBD2255608.1 hypothetical protein [Nostoc parmelioides FACHB-3921]
MKPIHGFSLTALGLFAGLAISSKAYSDDIAKLISIGLLGAIPATFITHLIVDTRAQRLINTAEDKLKNAGSNLHKVIRYCDGYRSQSTKLVEELQHLKDELREARNTINSLGHAKIENSVMIGHLNSKLDEYQANWDKACRENQLSLCDLNEKMSF